VVCTTKIGFNIKAVLFDFDGVMTTDKSGTESISNYISNKTGIEKNIFENEYRKYNYDLSNGKTTHLEIWDSLCKNIGIKIPIEVLYDSFYNTPIDNEMHKIVSNIKNQNIKTGLITDNKADRMNYINEKFEINKIFDIMAVSGVLGYGKESEKIFEITLKKLEIKPEESIFIDNQERNLIIPARMGINIFYYNDKERNIINLKSKLKDYGIII